ncbi:MAG TPA: hypothetical protein VN375_05520 [Vicinamibacteria bacterium]|nr:hypothetical protein [Vicinamibacteria bacterium]
MRRQTGVLRNLDDPLKLGPLTVRSWGVVLVAFSVLAAVDQFTGLLSLLPPFRLGMVWEVLGAAATALTLAYMERHEDEHFVPSLIRFYLSRPERFVYSAAANERLAGHPLQMVLRARASGGQRA